MEVSEILEQVNRQRVELIYKGFKPKYVFVDKNTYKELKLAQVEYVHREDVLKIKTYLGVNNDIDRLFGMLVIPLERWTLETFISVGI